MLRLWSIAIIWVCLVTPALGETCRLLNVEHTTEVVDTVRIGEQVTIRSNSGWFKTKCLTFLGRQGEQLLFFNRWRNSVVQIRTSELGLTRDLKFELLNFKREAGDLDTQGRKPNCASFTSFDCVSWLLDSGKLVDPQLAQRIKNRGQFIREFHEIASVEALKERRARAADQGGITGFLGSLLFDNQSRARNDYFRDIVGLEVSQTRQLGEIREHLQTGNPAIFDLNVRHRPQKVRDIDGQVMDTVVKLEPVPRSERDSVGHSMLGIAYLKTGRFSEHVLVLDPNGYMAVWPLARVRDSLELRGATLVKVPENAAVLTDPN